MAIPDYFELEGMPVRWVNKRAGPEMYVGRGKWKKYPKVGRVLEQGDPLGKAEFEAFLAEFDERLPLHER